ncbi:MAG: hypothetical protein JW891_08700 [Candidatus Lokiarchaeota archaeon]|nr:hypothetical protein [Candidatus Lokiarchaeota archaeon]
MNDNEEKIPQEDMIQRIIDPVTGRDITGESIRERLAELEIIAENIIERARMDSEQYHEKKIEIYKNYYWEIHQKLGMGSIGPATAAAGPLMAEKKEKLADLLEIPQDNRFD